MKRAGILTLYHGNNNYGGVLQAYALSETITSKGAPCEVIDYKPSPMPLKIRIVHKIQEDGITTMMAAVFRISWRNFKDRLLHMATYSATQKIRKREEGLEDFRKNGISHSARVYDKENLSQTLERYDLFVCGSDQIWNPGSSGQFNGDYWLEFVPSDIRKVAYAPSLTVSSLTTSQRKNIRYWLSSFASVSVRETSAATLLKEVTKGMDMDITCVLDPVFLINGAQWKKFSAPRQIKGNYVFAYLLGDDKGQRGLIQKFAVEQKLKVVTIPYLQSRFRFCDLGFGDEKVYEADPKEFLSLIQYADYVFTDSFHGTVFSSLFHKKFWVLRRDTKGERRPMDHRVEGLMGLYGTEERLLDGGAEGRNLTEEIDYVKVDRRIEDAREDSLRFLENALEERGI